MSEFQIQQSEHLSPAETEFWNRALRDRFFGELTLPWTEATRAAGPKNLEILYLQVCQGNERLALVVLHILRRLDLSGYMGPRIKSLFAPLGKIGIRPLALDLAFLEVPLANTSGIRLAPGAEDHSEAISAAVLNHVRKHFRYSMLCLKAKPGDPGEAGFARHGLMKTNFLAHMVLEFRGEKTWEEFNQAMGSKMRYECRKYVREFQEAGGTIEVIESPDKAMFDVVNRLHDNTLRHHRENSNLQMPIDLKESFFSELMLRLPGKSRLIVSRVKGEPVGVMISITGGEYTYATHCGLDYERSVPSRAYFNLFYAIIEDAIRRGNRGVGLGSEAYVLKKKLGGVPHPTVYHFEVRNPLLRGIINLVARNFESEEGSQLRA